jgi:hypothetical protein
MSTVTRVSAEQPRFFKFLEEFIRWVVNQVLIAGVGAFGMWQMDLRSDDDDREL